MLGKLSPTLVCVYLCLGLSDIAFGQSPSSAFKVVVNSNLDGPIQSDSLLTLREAIALVNGNLKLEQLSPSQRVQVQAIPGVSSHIEFNLPQPQTTIALKEVLPPLTSPGLVIDGTTQPSYDPTKSPTQEIQIPQPIVSITPASGAEVYRGFTVLADRITIRGLSIYGFTDNHRDTESTPPADIFIGDRFFLPYTRKVTGLVRKLPNDDLIEQPPKNVVIENNWLGIPPNGMIPPITSAFGVTVFNAVDPTIRRNRISYHDGSGIITAIKAEGMQVLENIILGNGMAGIPDGIRLEGMVNKSLIRSNLICGNDGSGVYLFKPEGATVITHNQIKFNGRRLRRAAVYLTGNDNQVKDNQISYQSGSGVVVAAYPQSDRNIIQNNLFIHLEGLSIDLNTQQDVGVQEFENGDGPNPLRDSPNRRRDTANAAINSPRFLSPEFFYGIGSTVGVDGVGEPNAQIDIYRVSGEKDYGALSEFLGSTLANSKGKFSLNLNQLQPGDRISAIATHPAFGTSEPAYPSLIRTVEKSQVPKQPTLTNLIPQCLTPLVVEVPQLPPEPIHLKVPKDIHFALDKDYVSNDSAKVLDQIAQVLIQHPSITIDIQGHTDIRASDAYNLNLAARRAKSVRNYLLRRGISPERMTIRSFGERQLLTTGTNKLDHARNRRVELIFQDIRGIEVIFQEQDLQLER
jgi:outer membrane protein OmpA-like peptidoglycan-associated protein